MIQINTTPKPDSYIEGKLEIIMAVLRQIDTLRWDESSNKKQRDALRPILVQIFQDGHEEGFKDAGIDNGENPDHGPDMNDLD